MVVFLDDFGMLPGPMSFEGGDGGKGCTAMAGLTRKRAECPINDYVINY